MIYLIIIVVIIIYYFYYKMTKKYFLTKDSSSCPLIVDYKTLKTHDIKSYAGNKILQQYMKYYFEDFINKTKDDWNYILPTDLYQKIKNNDMDNIFLIDVRKPNDYKNGHIKNSINIFWLDLLKNNNIKLLPKDKEIIIICYVGHTASQILVLLKLLGYTARVLKFGMGNSPSQGIPVAGWNNYGYPMISEEI